MRHYQRRTNTGKRKRKSSGVQAVVAFKKCSCFRLHTTTIVSGICCCALPTEQFLIFKIEVFFIGAINHQCAMTIHNVIILRDFSLFHQAGFSWGPTGPRQFPKATKKIQGMTSNCVPLEVIASAFTGRAVSPRSQRSLADPEKLFGELISQDDT